MKISPKKISDYLKIDEESFFKTIDNMFNDFTLQSVLFKTDIQIIFKHYEACDKSPLDISSYQFFYKHKNKYSVISLNKKIFEDETEYYFSESLLEFEKEEHYQHIIPVLNTIIRKHKIKKVLKKND